MLRRSVYAKTKVTNFATLVYAAGGVMRSSKLPAFNSESFFTELPAELSRKILNFACNTRLLSFQAGVGAIQADPRLACAPYNIECFEKDLRTLGALRATNKGRPLETFKVGNRYQYYNFVLEVWTVRNIATARRVYNSADYPGVCALTLDNLFKDTLRDETKKLRAIQAAAQKDPEAIKRAPQALRKPENPSENVKIA